MTNYGTKFNETDRELRELERLTHPTPEQRHANAALRFINNGRPAVRNQDVIEPIPAETFKWLANLLDPNPPWWRRLWRWLDPRKQFRDWDRDVRWCAGCGEVFNPYLYRCEECGGRTRVSKKP